MSMNVEAEIRELKRRVGELEGSFGFSTKQVQTLHKDLLALEAKTEDKLKEHDNDSTKLKVRSVTCSKTFADFALTCPRLSARLCARQIRRNGGNRDSHKATFQTKQANVRALDGLGCIK